MKIRNYCFKMYWCISYGVCNNYLWSTLQLASGVCPLPYILCVVMCPPFSSQKVGSYIGVGQSRWPLLLSRACYECFVWDPKWLYVSNLTLSIDDQIMIINQMPNSLIHLAIASPKETCTQRNTVPLLIDK